MHVYACIYACVYMCECMCTCVLVHMYAFVSVRVLMHMYEDEEEVNENSLQDYVIRIPASIE